MTDHTTHPEMPLQVEYALKAMEAKHEFEVSQQVSKVRSLVDQVVSRLNALAGRAEWARLQATMAEDKAVFLSTVFGTDTATIDTLLHELSVASQELENMRAAHSARTTLQAEANEKITAMAAQSNGEPKFEVVTPDGGTYL